MGPCAHLWPPLGTFSSLKFFIVLLQHSQKSPEKRGCFPWARVHIFGLHFALSIICTFLNSFATEPKDPCKKRALFDRLVWTLLALTWYLQLCVWDRECACMLARSCVHVCACIWEREMYAWAIWCARSCVYEGERGERRESTRVRQRSLPLPPSKHTHAHTYTLQPASPATHCNTLQHTASHYNTLQHTATHCNTLQHNATH